MCATKLFIIHESVLNRKTSIKCIHEETKAKPKLVFFAKKSIETYCP